MNLDGGAPPRYVVPMIILLALLIGDARFEPAGVRFGDVLLTGPLLEVREGALVSGHAVEPLAAPLRVEAGQGLTLTLDPGVRVARDVDGLRLSAHAPARLKVAGVEAESVLVRRTASGWAVGETALAGDVRVSLQAQPPPAQDDPDAALRAMQESARKMRESGDRVRKPIQRRVFTGSNPDVAGEAASSQAIRQLRELSASGF